MSIKNYFAYTENKYVNYPAYISLNKDDKNMVSISVRTSENQNSSVIMFDITESEDKKKLSELHIAIGNLLQLELPNS